MTTTIDIPEKPNKQPPAVTISIAHVIVLLVFALAGLSALSLAASLDWRLDLLTHFRVQYAASFLIAAIFLICVKMRKRAAIALAGFAINSWYLAPMCGAFFVDPQFSTAANDGPTASLKILHYNVNVSNGQYDDVAAVIRSSEADIVFLQEISDNWAHALEGHTGDFTAVALHPRSDSFGIGMWVHERIKNQIVSADVISLADGDTHIPAIDTIVQIHNKNIRVLSLHTLPPMGSSYANTRDVQLANAASLAAASDLPFVLIGDLNATPWSSSYRALVRAGGLTDSLRTANRSMGFGASWPSGLPALGKIPIDHCLTKGGAITTIRRLGESNGSDHQPLFVEIRF